MRSTDPYDSTVISLSLPPYLPHFLSPLSIDLLFSPHPPQSSTTNHHQPQITTQYAPASQILHSTLVQSKGDFQEDPKGSTGTSGESPQGANSATTAIRTKTTTGVGARASQKQIRPIYTPVQHLLTCFICLSTIMVAYQGSHFVGKQIHVQQSPQTRKVKLAQIVESWICLPQLFAGLPKQV